MSHPLLVVASFGPACASPEGVAALRAAGADVLRLNGSHLDPEELAAAVATAAAGDFPVRALLLDLQGGKTRTGTMPVPRSVAAGGSVCLAPEEARIPGAIPVDRAAFLAALRPGDRLALDDGCLHLRVLGPAPGGVAAVAETDRGRVYIVYGPPDRVEKRPDTEVWYYSHPGTYAENTFLFRRFFFAPPNLSVEDYLLLRGRGYEISWERRVQKLREGVMY